MKSDLVMESIAKRDYAVRLFVHYMTLTWNHVGLRVDSDNVAEWEDIVDSIIDAAAKKMEASK